MKAGAPVRQTTLAFATKAGNKETVTDKAEEEGSEGDASTKENSDPEKGKISALPSLPSTKAHWLTQVKKIQKNGHDHRKGIRKQNQQRLSPN